jgi:hypothetical protein
LFLHAFGGCAIELEDIRNPECTAWADALSAVTGLDRQRLLQARAARLDGGGQARPAESGAPALHVPDCQAHGVHEALRGIKNQPIPRSAQGRRQFQRVSRG